MKNIGIEVWTAVLACVMSVCTATAQQPNSKSAQHSHTKSPGLPEEDRLRMRLQFHPNDSGAHKQLIKVLKDKYAFRAIVAEDATWLSNNRSDSWTLTEIVSYSETALHDPEYAIEQLQQQLSAVSRSDDPEDYDDWSDQLAGKLQKRGRPEEALPLLSELVRLNPDEAGFWADYADVLSVLGKKDEAIKAFRRSIDLNPSMDAFHEVFAEHLRRAYELDPRTRLSERNTKRSESALERANDQMRTKTDH